MKSMNGLHAGSGAGVRQSADPDFFRVVNLMKELQATDSFGIRVMGKAKGDDEGDDEDKKNTAENGAVMTFRGTQTDEKANAMDQEVRHLLHLDPKAEEFALHVGAVAKNDKEIAMLTRSMLEILEEASAGVDIPTSDLDEGRAVRAEAVQVSSDTPRFQVRVHSSDARPDPNDASTMVRYRNRWFWIDDRDLQAKRDLGFLMTVFTLVESGTSVAPPALTLSKP